MAYKLNNIDVSTYGFIPSRVNGSNLAIGGFLDMPKRIEKTYHDWGDHDGVEPYVSANEIFFDGRDIEFSALFKADNRADAVYRLNDFYKVLNGFTDKVPFETPYGTFNVLIQDEIKVDYINNGWAKVNITFREPVVEIPTVIIPAATNYQVYGIDGVPFESIGLFVQKVTDNMNREASKKQNYSAYGYEGFQLTKTELHKASITLVAHKTNIADLTTSIGILHKQLASEGLRQLNIDNASRQAWSIDGFKVKNIKVGSNIAVAIIDIDLAILEVESLDDLVTWDTIGDYWNTISDNWDNVTGEPSISEVWGLFEQDWDNINNNWENI